MPDDLRPQLDGIVSYLTAAGVASFRRDGVEADDYIACLARHAAQAGWRVVIASADKDFMQLVSPQVGLLNPNDKSETIWRHEQVRAKTGVEPAQIVDWLALMGDSVDNIPGVPGVGPKTAAGLLNQFGSVAGLFGAAGRGEVGKITRSVARIGGGRAAQFEAGAVAGRFAVRICVGKIDRETGGCRTIGRIVPAVGIQRECSRPWNTGEMPAELHQKIWI